MLVRSMFFVGSLLLLVAVPAVAHDDGKEIEESAPAEAGGTPPIVSPRIEFLAEMPLSTIGGGGSGVLGNDIWGWTDPQNGKEYAIFGRTNGTSFIDVSNPNAPVYLGNLPTATGNKAWRDMKVYNNHAYVVADLNGSHGMQIIDLTQLRGVTTPQTFTETAHFSGFTSAHNIAINEATGFAYVVGANTFSQGMHFIDLQNPIAPTTAGGFSADGYTHDTQVVIYQGPDSAHQGREIAFNSNEDTLTIVDVTTKTSPSQLSRTGYAGQAYTHQGWLSEDHHWFYMNDELDERNTSASLTRTHVWDVSDLDSPQYKGFHEGTQATIDHNLYVHQGLIYQANYTSGLRILEPIDPATATLNEVASLDTYPSLNSETSFGGAWSVYPYFQSGTIIVSDRQGGLFVARLRKGDADGDGDIDNTDILTGIGNFTGPSGAPGTHRAFAEGSYDGDGDVDNSDMLTAIGNFTGPGGASSVSESLLVQAVGGSLIDRPNHTNLLYDPLTGNLKINPSEGAGGILTGYVLQSDGDFFDANHQTHLGGTATSLASELSEANNSSTIATTIDLGNVLPLGLSATDLEQLLTSAIYTGQSGSGVHDLDLVVVPEPRGVVLMLIGLGVLFGLYRLHRRSRLTTKAPEGC